MTIIYTKKASTSIPALTDGSVPFYSSGTLAEDNSNLSWNSTMKGLGLGVSPASVASRLHIGGNRSAASWTTNGIGIRTDSVTVTNTTSSGTVALQTQHGLGTPTFAASSATTFSDASTIYIAAAPVAGSNVTITRPWAQYVASGQLYIADGLRVGTTSQTSTIRFASTMTGTNAAANAIYGTGVVNMTSATSVQSAALTGDNSISGNQNNSNTTGMTGVEGITRSSNTATVTSLIGVKATGVNSGAGTVTNLYNMRSFNATNSGGGTITNLYGYYVDNLTSGTNNYAFASAITSGSNKWNLYMSGSADNYLAGNLAIGLNSSISAKLHVISTTEQKRLGYDASNYFSHTVSSAGVSTLDPVGTDASVQIVASTSKKLAFHNATPVVQRSGAAQASVVITSATNVTPYGYATQAQADALVTLVNEIRAALVEKGLIKGSA